MHRRTGLRAAILICCAATVALATAPVAGAATFSNSTSITIPPTVGNASPYPVSIVVSGLDPFTTDVNVSLNDYSHNFPDDVGVVVVGPTGAALKIMDGAGEDPNASGAFLTFDDAAASFLSDTAAPVTGTYKPTAYYGPESVFPAPGPGAAYAIPGPESGGTATLGSAFNGVNPNGTWNLFVRDFVNNDAGSIAGGWSLTITASASQPAPGAPVIDIEPPSPANDNNPEVFGSAQAGTTVDVYATADCSGAKAATGTAAQLAGAGLTVTVADNTTTSFSARATNGAGPSPCSAPITYSEVTPGGGPGPVVVPKVIAPAPVETKLDKSKIKGKKKKATFTFSGSGGTAPLGFECKLDKKPFKACTSPKKYTGLKPGKHTFQVRAKDAAGTVDATPATKKFSIPKPD
jgi:hypothetical protein